MDMRKNNQDYCNCLTANQYKQETVQCILPRPLRIAHAFVPIQIFGQLYSPAEALQKGTIFPELYSPYPY